MGRRKAAKKVVKKKKKMTVAKTFKCLYCNHEDSVNCVLNHESKIGILTCTVCDAKFSASINPLSEPIDIFSEWLDNTSEKQAHEIYEEAND